MAPHDRPDPPHPSGLRYRPDIDGLRALAVVPVVLYHAKVPGFSGGFVGVDVFFVISGFLITSILMRGLPDGSFSLLAFYERRVRRILPALLLVSGVTTLAAVALFVPTDLSDFARSLAGTLLFYANFVFAADLGYFDAPAETKPLLHMWSLAIEEQFYILYPLVLWGLIRARRTLLLPGLAALALCSFAAALWFTAEDAARAFFMPHLRAWELLAGALVALSARHVMARRYAEIAAGVGLALILLPVFLYDAQTVFPGLAALAPVAGAALVLHAGRSPGLWTQRLLSLPPLVGLGLISYALYLWHWPVLVFAGYIAMRPLGPGEIAALLVLSVVLAYGSWRWVERPFRNPVRVGRRGLFAGAASGMLVLLLVAGMLDLSRGLPQRFPQQIVAMVDAKAEMRAAYAACTELNRALGRAPEGADPAAFACRIGDPAAAPDFLLWGDSHAGVLVHAVAGAALEAGRAGWLLHHGGCPPLLDVEVRRGRDTTSCQLFHRRVAAFLTAERPRQVLLGARWALAETGTPYGEESEVPMRLELAGHPGIAAAFRAGLARSLAAIRAAGAETILIGPVPELGFDAPARMAQAWRFGADPPVGPAWAAFRARQAGVLEAFAALAAAADVTLVRPDALLCDATRCLIEDQGRTLYFDDDHLSLDGAARLIPLFADAMRR
ncbi:MAG: acyltransferase family protein [Pseudomonadota bacterium]